MWESKSFFFFWKKEVYMQKLDGHKRVRKLATYLEEFFSLQIENVMHFAEIEWGLRKETIVIP